MIEIYRFNPFNSWFLIFMLQKLFYLCRVLLVLEEKSLIFDLKVKNV